MPDHRRRPCWPDAYEITGKRVALVTCVSVDEDGLAHLAISDGRTLDFDSVYPMFGCQPRSELARYFQADCDADGNLLVDDHQMTSVARLYAAGDLVTGLNQISVAVGHAAVAATAIHNRSPYRFVSAHAPAGSSAMQVSAG